MQENEKRLNLRNSFLLLLLLRSIMLILTTTQQGKKKMNSTAQKFNRFVDNITKTLVKKNLIQIEEGEPSVLVDIASTGSVYATFYLANGRRFLLRFADHKMGCFGSCDFWAEKYKDGRDAVLAAAA